MSPYIWAIRGATTVDADTETQVTARVQELVTEVLERNGLAFEDLVSVIFTATDDIHSMFPAAAARAMGLTDVPLMCARELEVNGALPMCIRMMAHVVTERERSELRHVYLKGAQVLRDDLAHD
ncbi:MAG: chorismate mutase [Actinobacteria bacterium]|nr:chorismate mutase [Actinomycetota bacterium]